MKNIERQQSASFRDKDHFTPKMWDYNNYIQIVQN